MTRIDQVGLADVHTKRMVVCGGWACRVDPRYHDVLAVKVCALALGARLRPWAVFEP